MRRRKLDRNSYRDSVWWIRLWKHWHYMRCRHCKVWLTKNYVTKGYVTPVCLDCRHKHGHP